MITQQSPTAWRLLAIIGLVAAGVAWIPFYQMGSCEGAYVMTSCRQMTEEEVEELELLISQVGWENTDECNDLKDSLENAFAVDEFSVPT